MAGLLHVSLPSGEEVVVDVLVDDSIRALRGRVASKLGVPVTNLDLCVEGYVLLDGGPIPGDILDRSVVAVVQLLPTMLRYENWRNILEMLCTRNDLRALCAASSSFRAELSQDALFLAEMQNENVILDSGWIRVIACRSWSKQTLLEKTHRRINDVVIREMGPIDWHFRDPDNEIMMACGTDSLGKTLYKKDRLDDDFERVPHYSRIFLMPRVPDSRCGGPAMRIMETTRRQFPSLMLDLTKELSAG